MANTYKERIAEAKQKIEQGQNRMKRLIQEQRIEHGTILGSLIDAAEGMTNEGVKALLHMVLQTSFCADRHKRKRRDGICHS